VQKQDRGEPSIDKPDREQNAQRHCPQSTTATAR
jgi:hypothetical protein